MTLSKGTRVTLFVVLLLIVDQVVKILVKTHMSIGQSIPVFGTWFQILYIENNGMAFGLQFGDGIGKLALSLCRIGLIALIIVYLRKLLRRPGVPTGVLFGLAAILTGAVGNLIDSMFYGLIFEPHAPFLFGKVVDMLYFPLIDTTLPETFPIWGGRHVIFFRPIFNIADSCITCGAIYLLLFQWKFFSKGEKEKEIEANPENNS